MQQRVPTQSNWNTDLSYKLRLTDHFFSGSRSETSCPSEDRLRHPGNIRRSKERYRNCLYYSRNIGTKMASSQRGDKEENYPQSPTSTTTDFEVDSSNKSASDKPRKYEIKVSIPLSSLGGYVPRTPPPKRQNNFYQKSDREQDPWGRKQ
ncbi:hypothetical protein KPH14_007021 [Odynerus spinipes]|uniref:Uncharacterized protein n=1 Tax=Odynerus spinipes TaxID=1348599 RepID=A0AAD9RRM4_9HYME|nr:hypothetical protein KPH14_007021 [Odynerus spinipes]